MWFDSNVYNFCTPFQLVCHFLAKIVSFVLLVAWVDVILCFVVVGIDTAFFSMFPIGTLMVQLEGSWISGASIPNTTLVQSLMCRSSRTLTG